MIRRLAFIFAALAISLTGLTACQANNGYSGYYDSMCVDPYTQIRQPDYYCHVHPSWWYYVPDGYRAPGIHVHVTHYSVNHFHVPSGASTIHRGGVPTSGGRAPHFKSGGVNLKKSTGGNTNGGSTRKSRTSIFRRSGGGFGGSTRRGSTGRH